MPRVIDANIRRLTAADLEGALLLSSTAGWNQRLADWRMLLQLAPAGSFTALAGGHIVGTAIGIDYGRFAWIAMMLVDPAYRGQGLGARLLEAAMEAIPVGRAIRLDATPMGRPLYQRYGFEDETRLTRLVAAAGSWSGPGAAAASSREVRALRSDDLNAVTRRDRTAFGADRRVLLEWLREGAPGYAHILETDGGAQFCFGRPGRLLDQIGPVVADNDSDAQALVVPALHAANGKAVVADVFDSHGEFARWLREGGFAQQRPLFRMCRPGGHAAADGDRTIRANAALEYTILGPEFG